MYSGWTVGYSRVSCRWEQKRRLQYRAAEGEAGAEARAEVQVRGRQLEAEWLRATWANREWGRTWHGAAIRPGLNYDGEETSSRATGDEAQAAGQTCQSIHNGPCAQDAKALF